MPSLCQEKVRALFSVVSIYSLVLYRFISRPRDIDRRELWGCGIPNFLYYHFHYQSRETFSDSRTELVELAKMAYSDTLSKKLLLEYRLVSGLEKRREWAAKKLAVQEVRQKVLGLLFVIGCHPDSKCF